MRQLQPHSWGDPTAPRVVCLHGVTSHGRHFRRLAERLTPRFHVVAPDLLGHGEGYVYPHDDPDGFELEYLPEELRGRRYYRPSGSGEEDERAGSDG